MTHEALTVDAIQDHSAGISAEKAHGEHVAFADAESHGGELRGDVPLKQKAAAIGLDDDGTAVLLSVGPDTLTFVDTGQGRWFGRRLHGCRVTDQRTHQHREEYSQEQSGRTHRVPPVRQLQPLSASDE
jgi:hypothetical protein